MCCSGMEDSSKPSIGNQQDDFVWESGLIHLMKSAIRECINIKSGLVNGTKAGDRRMLFMPHSPGIYVALVLKDAAQIE